MIQAPSKKYVLSLEVPVENLTLMDVIQGQNNLGNIKYGNAKLFTDLKVFYLPTPAEIFAFMTLYSQRGNWRSYCFQQVEIFRHL